MSKFEVGDRVAVYDSRLEGGRQVTTVDCFDPNRNNPGSVCVAPVRRVDNDFDELIVQPQQLRKLKPKKRREIFIAEEDVAYVATQPQRRYAVVASTAMDPGMIRFVEAKPRRK
jgi:hypothetical protein